MNNISRSTWTDGPHTLGGSWGDYDSDGYIDLLLLMYNNDLAGADDPYGFGSETQFLMRNTTGETTNPDGGFVDASPSVLYEGDNYTKPYRIMSALWADFDRDHDVDLVLMQSTSDFGSSNPDQYPEGAHSRYLENLGNGAFADVSFRVAPISKWSNTHGVATAADFNNDGYLDIGYRRNGMLGVFFNDGLGSFSTDFSEIMKSDPDIWDLGSLDYDLDGRIDLMVGHYVNTPVLYGNRMVDAGGTTPQLSLIDETYPSQLRSEDNYDTRNYTYGMCLADFTADGLTELFWARWITSRYNFFYKAENVGLQNGWIGIRLESSNGANNRLGLGATVIVRSGSHVQAQVVDGGSGRASQHDLDLVFGLGDQSPGTVDVEVYWPNGHIQEHYLATGGYWNIEDTSLDVDDDSVTVEVEYNIRLNKQVWTFTWDTRNEGVPSEDEVVFDATGLSQSCTPPDLVLTPDQSDVQHSVTYDSSRQKWEHVLVWDDVPCMANCMIPFVVSSTVNGYTSTSTLDHKVSVPVCLSAP